MSTVYFDSVLCGSQTHGSDRGDTCSGVQKTAEQCWSHSRGLERPDSKARWGQRAPSCVRATLWLQRHCRPRLLCCHGHLSHVCKSLSQSTVRKEPVSLSIRVWSRVKNLSARGRRPCSFLWVSPPTHLLRRPPTPRKGSLPQSLQREGLF